MSDKLREALRRSADGWANAIEFGLLPEQHRKTATILCDEARAALAQPQSSGSEPRGCPTPGACSCPQNDAEPVARQWQHHDPISGHVVWREKQFWNGHRSEVSRELYTEALEEALAENKVLRVANTKLVLAERDRLEALTQLQSDQEAGQVTFQRWWIEHIRDGLVAMGKLPSGPLGDWAFLFREQLTDALNKPAPPPSSRMREALDTESIHQTIYNHTYMVLKGRVSERFLQEEFWNAAEDAAKEISRAGDDHDSDSKKSEGGGQVAPAKCSATGVHPTDTSCAAEPEVAPGPSDPAPPDREAIARAVSAELEQMHKDGVPMCMREGETTWRTYHAGFDLSNFAIRISDVILALRGGE